MSSWLQDVKLVDEARQCRPNSPEAEKQAECHNQGPLIRHTCFSVVWLVGVVWDAAGYEARPF